MSAERRQVLDLLANGKVTAEEAERLLERLGEADGDAAARPDDELGAEAEGASPETGIPGGGKTLKFLRVVVNTTDGDQVNVRVPIALVRTGIKLGAMLPTEAREKLDEKGIDLSGFSGMEGEELIAALRDLTVDVDSADGDVVRVFCE